jgi:hypothetical protein
MPSPSSARAVLGIGRQRLPRVLAQPGAGRQQGDPQRAVHRGLEDVHARSKVLAGREHLGGHVALRRAFRGAVHRLQVGQQGVEVFLLLRAQPAPEVGASRERIGGAELQRRERHRLVDAGSGPHRHRHRRALGLDLQRHHAACRGGGLQRHAEQAQPGQALPLRDQVGAVQDRVAQPGEQVDQRAAGVAGPGMRPLRRVRGNPRQHLGDQVVEAAVVERGRPNGHCATPSPG